MIEKAREFQENIYICFIDYAKAFDCVDHNKLWKILNCTWNNRLVPNRKKEYIKAVYCHPAYLTSTHSTSCEMPNWMKHKLESRFLGNISIASDMPKALPLQQKLKKN